MRAMVLICILVITSCSLIDGSGRLSRELAKERYKDVCDSDIFQYYKEHIKYAPIYPLDASQQYTTGWAYVFYNVYPNGTTGEIRVLDSGPDDVFDRASIRAAEKFIYAPLASDRQQSHTCNMFIFNIE